MIHYKKSDIPLKGTMVATVSQHEGMRSIYYINPEGRIYESIGFRDDCTIAWYWLCQCPIREAYPIDMAVCESTGSIHIVYSDGMVVGYNRIEQEWKEEKNDQSQDVSQVAECITVREAG